MSIVVEISDASYCETKAIEMIRVAQSHTELHQLYQEKISMAIGLLALARIMRSGS